MSPTNSGVREAFSTAATPVFVIVCVVADNVPIYTRPQPEPGRTEGAAVWPLSRVGPDMVSDVPPLREPGLAHMPLVILHTIAGLHMLGVVRHPDKRGTALLTPADHLPCVEAFVSRQATTLCERLPA